MLSGIDKKHQGTIGMHATQPWCECEATYVPYAYENALTNDAAIFIPR